MSTSSTDRENPPAPGSVSDQNGEEAEPGIPGGSDARDTKHKQGGAQERASEAEQGGRVGGASEGSQATGHPDSAG